MKKLAEFEKEISKCSKCGLCQNSCPIYQLTKNECCVSKGKFAMLEGVISKKFKLSSKINKYIDACLKCGKCSDYCPANIDICQILISAKYEYLKSKKLNFWLIKFFGSKYIFSNILKLLKFLTKHFRPNLTKSSNYNVIYFKGCVNEIAPNTDKYLAKIFKNIDINIITPNFECCGLPFLSEGNIERFEQIAKHNLNLLDSDAECIATDCASCEHTLLNYPKYLGVEDKISIKSANWGEIIAQQDLKFNFKKPITVTFHKPCHLKNDSFFEKIINNCQNVTYKKMINYDQCCGMAGSFAIKNPQITKKLFAQKANAINNTNADYVITTCPACIIGLKMSLGVRSKIKVISLLEFLALADIKNNKFKCSKKT